MVRCRIEIAHMPLGGETPPFRSGPVAERLERLGGRAVSCQSRDHPFDTVFDVDLPAQFATSSIFADLVDAAGPWAAYRIASVADVAVEVEAPTPRDLLPTS